MAQVSIRRFVVKYKTRHVDVGDENSSVRILPVWKFAIILSFHSADMILSPFIILSFGYVKFGAVLYFVVVRSSVSILLFCFDHQFRFRRPPSMSSGDSAAVPY